VIRDLGVAFDPKYGSRKRLIEFSLQGFPKATNVYLVGDLCYWFPGAYPMNQEGHTWKLTLPLYEGDYSYVYVVEGYKWLIDPENPKTITIERATHPHERKRSVLRVGDDLLNVVSTKGDGRIEPRGLYHDQTPLFLDLDGDNVYFKFRAMKNDASRTTVIIENGDRKKVGMKRIWSGKYFDYYEAHTTSTGSIRYFFEALDKDASAYFSLTGYSRSEDSVVPFKLGPDFKPFEVPNWARGALFYQIFPDRFYNGSLSNDPPKTSTWGSKPTRTNFFGGDLEGIINKLDYIASLGVDAIYLTPVFSSETNHKYDTYDYFRVDPSFGDNDTLRKLVKEAHARGIKVILDGVFHHTADEFWAFQDVLKNQSRSKYCSWYFLRKIPVSCRENPLLNALLRIPVPRSLKSWLKSKFPPSYETFAGVHGMPKLNLLNPETSEYFLKVAEYWIREADIDGWRLDLAHGIPHDFWKKFRSRLKALKPSAYLVGESWHTAWEHYQWIGDEGFDGIMNYSLRKAILDFFVQETTDLHEFCYRLGELRAKLPRKALFVMYNLLGSHDTPRILTLCKGDLRKAKLAILFQMSFPGAPVLYYGDEVGLLGGDDPDCRRTMIWNQDEWNSDILNHYKQLIEIRRVHPALTAGDFSTVKDEKKKVCAYRRTLGNDEIVTVLNNEEEKAEIRLKVERGCRLVDLLTGRGYETHNGEVTLELEPKNGLLLHKQRQL